MFPYLTSLFGALGFIISSTFLQIIYTQNVDMNTTMKQANFKFYYFIWNREFEININSIRRIEDRESIIHAGMSSNAENINMSKRNINSFIEIGYFALYSAIYFYFKWIFIASTSLESMITLYFVLLIITSKAF